MKTREYIGKLTTGKWTRMTVLAIAAFIVFGYLYSRGVSPVWTAVAIVCFRGFFRFLYKVALQDRAVLTEDGSFCVPCLMETGIMKTRSERKGRHIQPLTDRRTTGQSWQTPLFGRQGRALRVSGKNHPRPEGLRYFSRKPCLSGSVCRKALVVQRAAKAQVFTIKIIES